MKWVYGLTTVPSRRDVLFPRTLASLKAAGFDSPRLFVDGARDASTYGQYASKDDQGEYKITTRYNRIRTHGNWILSLYELYIREPNGDRYAIFQDDFVTYRNLRAYLESCPYPTKGYLNCFTFPVNQARAPKVEPAWYLSDQCGKGAVALVFDLETVKTLLCSRHMVDRPQDAYRGWRAVDGGIITSLKQLGWNEYVHNPSLVQHTGTQSSMENNPQPLATSFRGEEFDASTMVAASAKIYVDAGWEEELKNLNEAIAGDEVRLKNSVTPADRGKYQRLIFDYKCKLQQHLQQKPAAMKSA